MLGAVASTVMGVTAGMMVGDSMGSVAMPSTSVPAVSHAASTKTTASGKPVSKTPTPRQSLTLSAMYVVAAMVILIGGSKFLKEARIA